VKRIVAEFKSQQNHTSEISTRFSKEQGINDSTDLVLRLADALKKENYISGLEQKIIRVQTSDISQMVSV